MVDFGRLPTEQKNPASARLDRLTAEQIIALMNKDNAAISKALAKESVRIARAAELIASSLKAGGKLFFAGAGTSGRLGVLEAAELPPTFGTPPTLAQALMAGGRKAVFRSQEGAEDNEQAARALVRSKTRKGDILVGIAASGVTPFVRGALNEARRLGAKTIFLSCNKKTQGLPKADIAIALDTGPEIVTGSTRLKAGSATKMALNMLTTAAMVRLGKTYGNRMVDLQPKSKKLRERGLRLVRELTGLPRTKALRVLVQADWRVKTAVLMARKGLSSVEANRALALNDGSLRDCLGEP